MEGAAKTQWSCNVLTPQTHQLQRSTLPLPWTSGLPGPFLRLTYSFEKKAFESRVLHNKNDTQRLDTIFFFFAPSQSCPTDRPVCAHTQKGSATTFSWHLLTRQTSDSNAQMDLRVLVGEECEPVSVLERNTRAFCCTKWNVPTAFR